MRYVRAILSQEVGWFDACGASELSTNVAELTGKIQDGLGRKMGDMCQYLAQVVAALGVAFYLSWKLTLVLLCAVPFIGAAGKVSFFFYFRIFSLTWYASQVSF